MAQQQSSRPPLAERCRGRWASLLPLLGMERAALSGKHGPCPLCKGGKDRWRWINREGSGDWICSVCGHGDGVELAKLFLKLDFKAAADRIEAVLNEAKADKPKPPRDDRRAKQRMKELWERAWPITAGSPGARYLRHTRGLALTDIPSCLRFLPDCPYDHERRHPAIVAKVCVGNEAVNLHRIFITPDGRKAPLDPARKLMMGTLPPGAAVRLVRPAASLGVAEGIETALAAMQLFGVPTWSVIVAGGMERFVVPEGVEELVIFADNDASFTGHKTAYALANRAVLQFKIRARVAIPPKIGDWNDILIQAAEGVAA